MTESETAQADVLTPLIDAMVAMVPDGTPEIRREALEKAVAARVLELSIEEMNELGGALLVRFPTQVRSFFTPLPKGVSMTPEQKLLHMWLCMVVWNRIGYDWEPAIPPADLQ